MKPMSTQGDPDFTTLIECGRSRLLFGLGCVEHQDDWVTSQDEYMLRDCLRKQGAVAQENSGLVNWIQQLASSYVVGEPRESTSAAVALNEASELADLFRAMSVPPGFAAPHSRFQKHMEETEIQFRRLLPNSEPLLRPEHLRLTLPGLVERAIVLLRSLRAAAPFS